MDAVSDIFGQLDAARARLVREGNSLRCTSPRPVPLGLVATLKREKAALLAKIPDGYGWERGAIYAKPPDLWELYRRLAPDGEPVDRNDLERLIGALLAIDDRPRANG